MPAPATADEFLELIRKSGVVDESRLSAYVKQLQTGSNTPTDMSKYAGLFVRDGMLTFFQAEQFLLGKWKRFTIGKYKVLERIGSGGMGQVFLCEHKLMRRKVAVKVLPTAKAEDPSSLERFYREARAVAALDHPNIVRAYDIDQDDNLHFLVMEYVDGASLQDIIKRHGAMDVVRACHYMYWSAIGLQHAHEAGLIHRDIKPGNILIDRQGTVKILDLGLACFFNDDEDLLTKKYDENVLGTADYLAPEQALDSHSVDGRADIYSLGATFYFLLAGVQPFVEGTVAQKLIWHQTRNPKSLRDLRPEVPEGIVAIVEKMMAKDPANRYMTPEALAEALAPWVQTPIPPPPDKEMPTLSAAAQSVGGGSPTTTTIRQVPQSPKMNGGSSTSQQQSSPSDVPVAATKQAAGGSDKRGSKPTLPSMRLSPTPLPLPPEISDSEDTARRSNPAPIIESLPADSEPAVWESLSQDTNNTARDNTARPAPPKSKPKIKPPRPTKEIAEPEQKKPAPIRNPVSSRQKKKPPPPMRLVIAVSAGVVVVCCIAVWFFVLRTPSKTTESALPNPGILTVAKSGGQFKSVREALNKANEGSHIVIQDSPWEEVLTVTSGEGKGVTIEGAENKVIVWKLPSGSSSNTRILTLSSPERMKIRNLTFDGETSRGGQIAAAIHVTSRSAGLVLEDLTVRNFAEKGILFVNCIGTEKDRAVVQRVRLLSNLASPAKSAITISGPVSGLSEWITVEDCSLAGPFTEAAVQIESTVKEILFKDNRIWNAKSGFYFAEPQAGNAYRVNIVRNTFHTMDAVVRFQKGGPLAPNPKFPNNIDLEQNYFFGVKAILTSPDNTFLNFPTRFVSNARGGGSPEGAGVPPGSIPIVEAAPALAIIPDEDGHFLRPAKDSNLLKQPKPVGVPAAN